MLRTLDDTAALADRLPAADSATSTAGPRLGSPIGDIAVRRVGGVLQPRTPHWTNAVEQARRPARTLLGPDATLRADVGYQPDPYFWTEQCGLDVRISGELPLTGRPTVIDSSLADRTALVQWRDDTGPVAAAAINHRMPVVALKKLGYRAQSPRRTTSTARSVVSS